ncbi:MAG: SRPBCC family protein, partial [Anaerolineae bacterium]|nr:SRPBCC family protein [Anaerolineae bacterium]
MINFTLTTVINRPVDEVFTYITDVRNEPQWMPGVLEAEQTSAEPVGVGTTYYELVELLGQQVELTFEVTEY